MRMVAKPSPEGAREPTQDGKAVARNTTMAVINVMLPPCMPKCFASATPAVHIMADNVSAMEPSRTLICPLFSLFSSLSPAPVRKQPP
jgi:hypothetical protein